jgi:hypothetical protein
MVKTAGVAAAAVTVVAVAISGLTNSDPDAEGMRDGARAFGSGVAGIIRGHMPGIAGGLGVAGNLFAALAIGLAVFVVVLLTGGREISGQRMALSAAAGVAAAVVLYSPAIVNRATS